MYLRRKSIVLIGIAFLMIGVMGATAFVLYRVTRQRPEETVSPTESSAHIGAEATNTLECGPYLIDVYTEETPKINVLQKLGQTNSLTRYTTTTKFRYRDAGYDANGNPYWMPYRRLHKSGPWPTCQDITKANPGIKKGDSFKIKFNGQDISGTYDPAECGGYLNGSQQSPNATENFAFRAYRPHCEGPYDKNLVVYIKNGHVVGKNDGGSPVVISPKETPPDNKYWLGGLNGKGQAIWQQWWVDHKDEVKDVSAQGLWEFWLSHKDDRKTSIGVACTGLDDYCPNAISCDESGNATDKDSTQDVTITMPHYNAAFFKYDSRYAKSPVWTSGSQSLSVTTPFQVDKQGQTCGTTQHDVTLRGYINTANGGVFSCRVLSEDPKFAGTTAESGPKTRKGDTDTALLVYTATAQTGYACNAGEGKTPVCGDGKKEGGEQCEQGDAKYPADDCTVTTGDSCQYCDIKGGTCSIKTKKQKPEPKCGDGIVQEDRGEQCDYADTATDALPTSCTPTANEPSCQICTKECKIETLTYQAQCGEEGYPYDHKAGTCNYGVDSLPIDSCDPTGTDGGCDYCTSSCTVTHVDPPTENTQPPVVTPPQGKSDTGGTTPDTGILDGVYAKLAVGIILLGAGGVILYSSWRPSAKTDEEKLN